MSLPTIHVEVMFDAADPFDTSGTWTDLADHLDTLAVVRGRQTEDDQAQTGTATVALIDDDRRFDPNYAGELVNLLNDPSYESASSGEFAASGATLSQDATEALFGSYGMKVVTTGGAGGNGMVMNTSLGPAAAAGQTFTASAYVLAPAGTVLDIRLVERNASNANVGQADSYPTATGAWQRISVTRTIASGTTTHVTMNVGTKNAVAVTMWIDGMQLEQAATASDYCDGDQDNCRWAGTPNASQSYRGGPYYPNVIPMLPLRVRAILDSAEYDCFYGWLDVQNAWIRTQVDAGHSEVSLPANDGFEILTNSYFSVAGTAYSSELTGARITEVFTSGILGGAYPVWSSSGWDLGTSALASSTILAQSIEAIMDGYETMQAYTYTSPTAVLQAVRDAELTEPGFFFFSGAGYPVFHDRRYRLGVSTSVATFVDEANYDVPAAIPFTSLTTRRTNLWNDIIVNRQGGTAQEATDADSITRNLDRQKSMSTMHTDDANALAAAEFYLSLRKDSYEIIESLTITPGDDSDVWAQVLGREIGDRITVIRTPEDVGSAITEDYFIENVSWSWGPGPEASCTWRLSSSADEFNYWLAGVAGSSEAGTTTKAGY